MASSDRPQTLEPKYCELCGALWLRYAGCDAVYCRSCTRIVAQMPVVTRPVERSGP